MSILTNSTRLIQTFTVTRFLQKTRNTGQFYYKFDHGTIICQRGCRKYGKKVIQIQTERDFELLANEMKKRHNIMVVCGAGISTPSGIPDFRSTGTGLYDNLSDNELTTATDVFDLRFFSNNPKPFFRLAKSLYPGNFRPNRVHYFLKLLSDKDRLLRIYTQNIDTLESVAGIPDEKIVFAHGSFNTASCMTCSRKYDASEIKDEIMREEVPRCCNKKCQGVIKPDVIFFGEDLPLSYHDLAPRDLLDCDLMLILGTSLEVFPVAGLVYQLPKGMPRVLMNKYIVDPFTGDYQTRSNDFVFAGDLVQGVELLVQKLNWEDEFDGLTDDG